MPVRGRRTHQKKRGIGRGRMFLAAKMGWLPGIPVGQAKGSVHWIGIPDERGRPVERYTLTRENLHDATLTWSKLIHRFPHALPSVVNDLDRWRNGVPQLLEWLKAAIHDGHPFPQDPFEIPHTFAQTIHQQAVNLKAAWATGADLVAAIGWLTFLRPDVTAQALHWLDLQRTGIETILGNADSREEGIILVCKLWELHRRENGKKLSALMMFCGHPVTWTRPHSMHGMQEYLNRWQALIKRTAKPVNPEHTESERPILDEKTAAANLTSFVDHLFMANRSACRQLLTVFDALYRIDSLEPWADWHRAVDRLRIEGKSLVNSWVYQTKEGPDAKQKLDAARNNLVQQISALKKSRPTPLYLDLVVTTLFEKSGAEFSTFRDQLNKLLLALPSTQGDNFIYPLSIFLSICRDMRWWPIEQVLIVIEALTAYHNRFQKLSNGLKFWQEMGDAWKRGQMYAKNPFDTLVDSQLNRAELAEVLTYWGEMLTDSPVEPTATHFDQYISLYGKLKRRDIALMRTKDLALAKEDRFIRLTCAEIAHKWAESGPAFVNILEETTDGAIDIIPLRLVDAALERAGWIGAGQDLVAEGHLAHLFKLGDLLQPVSDLGEPIDPPPAFAHHATPDWFSRYPADFHPALGTLCGFTPHEKALSLANNVLGKAYPDPAAIKAEIDHLAAALPTAAAADQPKLGQRLASLKKRLNNKPRPLSPKKRNNLNRKLFRTVQHEMLHRWEADLQAGLEERLRTRLDVQAIDPALLNRENGRLLPHILTLDPEISQLGLDLLRARCGPDNWCLQTANPNQNFVKKLSQRGLNLTPWLNPPAPQPIQGENGTRLIFSIESDPLEILHMGGHFKTCLTPGRFNFWSAVVNAADINKQVIYGRTEEGKVMARCLIGLTETGAIVAFHPYCHDGGFGIRPHIGRLVDQLATEMGTIVLPHGQVPYLMATEWYDDGPVDISERFDFLKHGSPFRKKLLEIEPNDLISLLETTFAPLPLNELTLPLILNLNEIKEGRPELLRPLYPLVRQFGDRISNENWSTFALGLHKIGETGAARDLIIKHGVPYLLNMPQALHDDGHFNDQPFMLLAQFDPVLAMQVIRRTRAKRVKSDLDEPMYRARILIEIYARLHRPKQKAALEKKWSGGAKRRGGVV